MTIDGSELPFSLPPDVQELAHAVLAALIRQGRWADAAEYCARIDLEDPLLRTELLLAAGGAADAVAGLIASLPDECEPGAALFIRRAAAVIGGKAYVLPDLIQQLSGARLSPLIAMIMLRAADAAGQEDLAAHYGRAVLSEIAGDVDAARAVAVDCIAAREYVEAVEVLDQAYAARSDDTPTPLQVTADALLARGRKAQLRALTTIGHYAHRETDPTRPVSESWKTMCTQWRIAFRLHVPDHRRIVAARLALLGAGLVLSLAMMNALPGFLIGIATLLWQRHRPVPGLDQKTSRIVRALYDPLLVVKTRRYSVMDVFVFVMASVITGGLVAQLPRDPAWLTPLKVAVAFGAGAAATWGRRRWIRRDNQELLRSPVDPARCTCQDFAGYRGIQGRRYIAEHLFNAGPVPAAPSWNIAQCLQTHTMFLHLPTAGLALRLTGLS